MRGSFAFARRLVLILLLGPLLSGCDDGDSAKAEDAETTPASARIKNWADAGPTKIRLTDVSAQSGIDVVNHSGRRGIKEFLPEAVGVGPSWLDYDHDGLLDLYVPDGDVYSNYTLRFIDDPAGEPRPHLEPKSPRSEQYRDQLWKNNGDGTFTDVSKSAHIDELAWSFGSTAFDYNGDGWTDIFVANFGKNSMWRNNGDGTFTEVAEALGVAGDPWDWTTCAAVGDIDGDGRIDMYVVKYSDPAIEVDRQRVKRGLSEHTPVESITGRDCRWRSLPAYCGPRGLAGQHDTMYRQTEDGTFEDVTAKWGLIPRVAKYGFTTAIFDFNDDGLQDIYVANDSEENFMWEQERGPDGAIRFRDSSDTLGVKYGHNLSPQASMGVAVADFNRDGLIDIFVTNFSHDYNNIYLGHRAGGEYGTFFYKDRGLQVMGQAVFFDLSWGCGWIDFDNDADLDLYFANGHVYKEIDLFEKTGAKYDQYNTLFECMDAENLGFREIGTKGQENAPPGVDPKDLFAGNGMAVEKCTRGIAFGDWNNDGRMELFAQNMNERPTLLLNTKSKGDDANWIKLALSQPGFNPEALGALVEITTGEITQRIPVLRLSSFVGTDDPRLHVGLGGAKSCKVKVVWPGRARESTEYEDLHAGKFWKLDRASGTATPIKLRAFTVSTK